MNKQMRLASGTCVLAMLTVASCDRTESTTATPPNSGTGMTGVGSGRDVTGPAANEAGWTPGRAAAGAPSYGKPSGMGFSDGDAVHAGGQGGGLMGFHDTGAA